MKDLGKIVLQIKSRKKEQKKNVVVVKKFKS